MPQKKRKDNPGKLDKRNPPLKTRLPVTGHPQPSSPQPPFPKPPSLDGYESDASIDTNNNHGDKSIVEHINETWRGLVAVSGKLKDRGAGSEWWFHIQEIFKRINRDFGFEMATVYELCDTMLLDIKYQTTPLISSTTPCPPLAHKYVEASTQTTLPTPKPKPTTNSVSTNTDPPPTRTYAEAATTTTPPSQPPKDKGKAPAKATPPPTLPPPRTKQNPPSSRVQAVVLHAAPTKYKPGLMRRWIEGDNKTAQIQGIRWLLKEDRRIGKSASSLVIYMTETIDLTHGLRMGRRLFRTTAYDWGR